MKRIYLDYAATTPTCPEVAKTMMPYFTEIFGNASSFHSFGQEAKVAIEDARERIADFIGAEPSEIVFTSGGTESDNFAVKGAAHALKDKGNHIIISQIEHHAILESCESLEKQGFNVTYLPVDSNGIVNPEDVKNAITDKTILISIMHANNEMGAIQPISEIGKIAKEKKVWFHTDAVQTFGHLPVNVKDLNVDMLSASAHKLCGPKGIGALYIRKGVKLTRFMEGGGQERNRRASTENVPGIVGFGKAVEIASKIMIEESERITVLRNKLTKGIQEKIPHVKLNGDPIKRLPNNVNVSIQFIEGESILLNLDMEGVAASTGSACTSGTLDPSHVMLAMGLSHELSHGSLRLTLGRYTEEEDINRVLDVLPGIVEKLRKMSPLYKG